MPANPRPVGICCVQLTPTKSRKYLFLMMYLGFCGAFNIHLFFEHCFLPQSFRVTKAQKAGIFDCVKNSNDSKSGVVDYYAHSNRNNSVR
jgi:hypothetical protein